MIAKHATDSNNVESVAQFETQLIRPFRRNQRDGDVSDDLSQESRTATIIFEAMILESSP